MPPRTTKPRQHGGFQLLKTGLAGTLGNGAGGNEIALFSDEALEKVFGRHRVGFYRALRDSVRDFKSMQLKTDKRSEAIKRLRDSKGEMAEIVKNVRDQLMALGPDKVSKLASQASEKAGKVASLQKLRDRVSKTGDDEVRRWAESLDPIVSQDKEKTQRARTSVPSELKKYITVDTVTRADVEERIRVDIQAIETEASDVSTTSAVIAAITATQSYLADAATLVIRTRATAKLQDALDLKADEELNREDVVMQVGSSLLDAEFFNLLFTKLKNMVYKIAPLDPINNLVAISPFTFASDSYTATKGIDRYRNVVESLLRYFSGTVREADDAVRRLEKENKGPLGSAKVPSAKEVYTIYNAFEEDRRRRMELINEIAFDLGHLVQDMEAAREYAEAEAEEGTVNGDLKAQKRKEFNFECKRIQTKIDAELNNFPELRELYLSICSVNDGAPRPEPSKD